MNLSPLRYPGGKSQYIPLLSNFANIIPHDRYIEPFAGGSSIALHFAINRATPVVINDKDPAIFAFWHSVINKTKKFIERIDSTLVDLKTWDQSKEILLNYYKRYNKFELGFATFFLNRCNFSGCLNANPIGGKKQFGRWKIDARFNKKDLIKRIKIIEQYKSLIKVSCLDALDLVRMLSKNDLIYLDPPYYNQGKNLYKNFLKDEGHKRLYDALQLIPSPWIMSYDNCEFIRLLYKHKIIRIEDIRYSFLNKKKNRELLISDNF